MTLYCDDRGSFDVEIPDCQDCGADAVALFPGADGDACDLSTLTRPTPGFGLCLACAKQRGWPNLPRERVTQPAAIPAAGQGVVI